MNINQTTDRSKILNTLMSLTVAQPNLVKVVENQFRDSVEYFVTCADDDYGKLVGKAGNNVKAGWSICDAASLAAFGYPGTIIVKTPADKKCGEPQKFIYDPKFTDAVIKEHIMSLCSIVFERGVVEVSSTDPSQAFVQITAHGYLHPQVDQDRLDAAFDRVASCIGNAHGRHVKAEVNFRTE